MKIIYTIAFIFVFSILILPSTTLAHQPRITTEQVNSVIDPEISKAYYGGLKGSPHIYRISSAVPFNLYLNVLVPDIEGQTKEVSMVVVKNKDEKNIFLQLKGVGFEWKRFFEPFGQDWYWQGPEYKALVEAGQYDVYVWDPGNDSKYVFAVGEKEKFNLNETLNAIDMIPELKKSFFNSSPLNFIYSPIGYGYILIVLILSFSLGFIYRYILKMTVVNVKSVGFPANIPIAVLGLLMIYLAITTTWGFLIVFVAGIFVFESLWRYMDILASMCYRILHDILINR